MVPKFAVADTAFVTLGSEQSTAAATQSIDQLLNISKSSAVTRKKPKVSRFQILVNMMIES